MLPPTLYKSGSVYPLTFGAFASGIGGGQRQTGAIDPRAAVSAYLLIADLQPHSRAATIAA